MAWKIAADEAGVIRNWALAALLNALKRRPPAAKTVRPEISSTRRGVTNAGTTRQGVAHLTKRGMPKGPRCTTRGTQAFGWMPRRLGRNILEE